MFSFASGSSSIGGGFSANRFSNSPVSFGGNITQGDMSTGATTQDGTTHSEGGTSDQKLDLSIPPIPALMMLDTENTGFMAFGKSANNINFRGLYDYAQHGGNALEAIGAAELQDLSMCFVNPQNYHCEWVNSLL